jgi:serine/threonine protein kinase
MTNELTLDDLMLRWEAARQKGENLSVEVLCAEAPQLAVELSKRIQAVLAMEQVLGVTGHDPQRTIPANGDPSERHGEVLPIIPGYEMIRMVDQGGMGVVYEARQLELSRTVAVKMISSLHLRPKVVARFRSEAEAAARLQHPNFVQIFEVGQVNGRPFFAMEFVSGGSLAELLTRKPPGARGAAQLVETLARAVHAAHERGIVHRDLKPSNVMLAADGTPKIADFGLAKRLGDDSGGHTHTGEVLGTPSYMAPEQAEGHKDQIGPHTDVYALGAILYEMLAGKPPFQGASPLDALRQVVNVEPTPPSRLVASIPRDLEAICLKCLEKSPRQRYGSALALADDLRRFLDGRPVVARRIGPVQRFGKMIYRHPQAVALSCMAVVLILIPVTMLVTEYRSQQQIKQKAEAAAPHVHAILHRHCFECHGQDPDDIQQNLNILDHAQLLDSVRGVVVPGAPLKSRLIHRIDDGSMPPEEDEKTLPRVSEEERTILHDWILGGAPPLPAGAPIMLSTLYESPIAAKVKKIFAARCYECHKYDSAKGGVKILNHRVLTTGRKVVIPGEPDKSDVYTLLLKEDKTRMPKQPRPRLPADEIAIIRQWIEEGALPFPKTVE